VQGRRPWSAAGGNERAGSTSPITANGSKYFARPARPVFAPKPATWFVERPRAGPVHVDTGRRRPVRGRHAGSCRLERSGGSQSGRDQDTALLAGIPKIVLLDVQSRGSSTKGVDQGFIVPTSFSACWLRCTAVVLVGGRTGANGPKPSILYRPSIVEGTG